VRLVLLAYSLGVMLGSFTDGSLRAVVIPGLFACGLLCALGLRVREAHLKATHSHSALADCLWTGAGLCVGLAWHALWAFNGLSGALPGSLEGRNLPVTGGIISLPLQGRRAQRFQFYIHSCDCEFQRRRILLNYYGDASLQVGQRWQFTVRLNKPRGYANPGSFDYEAWLFQQRIAARGYVRLNAPALLAGHNNLSIAWWRYSAK
jgi:predicted membrane metal-binding protein